MNDERRCDTGGKNCGTPRLGLKVCNRCIAQLRQNLNACETTRQELMVTLARQDRIGASAEGHSRKVAKPGSDQWLKTRPYNIRASEALYDLRNELVGWTRMVNEETGDPLPNSRIVSIAAWLAAHLDYIAKHEAAADIVKGIRHVMHQAERAVDLPRDKAKVKVGPCPERETTEGDYCPGTIYAYIPQDDGDNRGREYRPCLICTHEDCTHETREWTAEQWARMGRRIQQRQGIAPTMDEQAVRRLADAVMA